MALRLTVPPATSDRPAQAGQQRAAMSIDVEDWFHVENLRRVVPRDTWPSRTLRVEASMDRMLAIMEDCGVRSTCFVLGAVAERVPALVRRIAEAGHEIASHGYDHELVHETEPEAFRADAHRSKALLEDISGREVRGYRAPSFSITDWALPILREVGYEYDSSYFPTSITHSRYGRPSGWTNAPIARHDDITEVGLSCLEIGARALPWAGGGYFRLIPYPAFRLGVERILGSGKPYVFYIHPWELDAGQPRVTGLRRSERMRHYLNLGKTKARWTALLRDFHWAPVSELVQASEVAEGSPEPRAAVALTAPAP